MLFTTPGSPFYFSRLSSFLIANIGNSVRLRISPGKTLFHPRTLVYSFGNSTIHCPQIPSLTLLCHLLDTLPSLRHLELLDLTVTPARCLTMTELCLVFVHRQSTTKTQDTTLASCFPAFFWIHLFRVAHLFCIPSATHKIRRFINLYTKFKFNLPSLTLPSGISFNLTVNFSRNVDISRLSACHRAILTSHTTLRAYANCYTTMRKPKQLRDVVLNFKKWVRTFKRSNIPTCVCRSKFSPLPHRALMPFDLPTRTNSILRNLNQPDISECRSDSISLIYHDLLQLILQLRTVNAHTSKPLSDIDILSLNLPNNITLFYGPKSNSIPAVTFSTPVFSAVLWYCSQYLPISNFPLLMSALTSCALPALLDDPAFGRTSFLQRLVLFLNTNFQPLPQSNPHTTTLTRRLLLAIPPLCTLFHLREGSPLSVFLTDLSTTFAWSLSFNLYLNGIPTTVCHRVGLLFAAVFKNCPIPHNNRSTFLQLSNDIRTLISDFSGWVFVTIDHNTKTAALICPVRYHSELSTTFLDDVKHFRELSLEDSLHGHCLLDLSDQAILNFLHARAIEADLPLPHTWKIKPTTRVPSLYVTIKEDGCRFRPVGTYFKTLFRRLFGIFAVALFFIVRHSGIKQSTQYTLSQLHDLISSVQNLGPDLLWIPIVEDIKSFFTAVPLNAATARLQFVFNHYISLHGTDLVSVPINKLRAKPLGLVPHTGPSFTGTHFTISCAQIHCVLNFASKFAIFRLGRHLTVQFDGLPMGDPLSPARAISYVAFDEHHSRLPTHINTVFKSHTFNLLPSSHLPHFTTRYVDDILLLVGFPRQLPWSVILAMFSEILAFFEKHVYDYDNPSPSLFLEPSAGSKLLLDLLYNLPSPPMSICLKFLDSNIVCSAFCSSVRLCYHNKNEHISSSQSVSRFESAGSVTPISQRLRAFATILIRAFDTCTFKGDICITVLEIAHELIFLHYCSHHFLRVLNFATRARPNPVWNHARTAVMLTRIFTS